MAGIKKKGKTLADQIAELDDPTPKDFDPEDQNDHEQTSDDEQLSEEGEGLEDAGREHYEAVGKSKLRQPQPVELGREYAGSRVTREALNGNDSDHDPFASGGSDEGSEVSEEDEMSGLEGSLGDSEEDEDEMDDMDESKVDEDGDEDEDMESEEDEEKEEERKPSRRKDDLPDDREELRRLMASDHKVVAASISQAAKADAAKGAAVKRQRRAFDALLNSRIKLQKGLTSLNDIEPNTEADLSVHGELIKSAETAAISLWNALDDLRHALADSRSKHTTSTSSKKRKRTPISTATPSSEIWSRMSELETQSLPPRRAVLDKWSLKARGIRAALPSSQNKLLANKADQQTITAVLDAHIATETPSATTGSRNAQPASSTTVYDDTAFYQSLLRDLVEQRMSSSATGLDTQQLPSRLTSLSIHPTTGMRKDKVKRAVDTKASKGRKMKYNVHEKLQNFMAPEDTGSWGDRAREEFFASLLGRSAREMLGEEDEDGNGVVSDEDNAEESGLRLFRN